MTAAPAIEWFGRWACSFTVGERTWFFSYDDLVAFRRRFGPTVQVRAVPKSITTHVHMQRMGVLHWPVVEKLPERISRE